MFCDVLIQQELKLNFAKLILKQIKSEIMGARKIIFLERISYLLITSHLASPSIGLHTNRCYFNNNSLYLFHNFFLAMPC